MPATEWIMVRVSLETHTQLTACKRRFESEANAARPIGDVKVERFGLSLDSVVKELIRRDENHRARSKRSQEKRRKGGSQD